MTSPRPRSLDRESILHRILRLTGLSVLLAGGCTQSAKDILARTESGRLAWSAALAESGESVDVPVEVEGRTYDVRVVRSRGRDGGPTLVFLHGVPGGPQMWWPVLDARFHGRRLRERRDVVLVETIGLGRSEQHLEGGFAAHSDAIGQTLDQLELDAFILVGHSYGGELAWRVASARPSGLQGLVLINAAGFRRTGDERDRRDRWAGNSVGEVALWFMDQSWLDGVPYAFTSRGEVEKGLRAVYGRDDALSSAALDEYHAIMKKPPSLEVILGFGREELHRDDEQQVRAALRRIDVPVQLIWGTQDDRYTVQTQMRNFQRSLRDARKPVRIDAGHNVQEERPDAVAAAIDRFVRGAGR